MHHAYIDKFAYQDSTVHRLDSRVKLVITFIFTLTVLSASGTSVSVLVCYAVWPFAVLVFGKIPFRFTFKQIALVSPFILVFAVSCVFYDRTETTVVFGPFVWQVWNGWIRCFAITGKFIVTMMALIAMVSTTKFSDLLIALQKFHVPKLLIIQLGLLYRYIFVLIDKAHHILRARAARKLIRLGVRKELQIGGSMIGSLFVQSIHSAEQINSAMHARGFSGKWRTLSRLKICGPDYIFIVVFIIFITALHFMIRPILQ